MTKKEFTALVKRFGGWIEGDIARFPTVHDKEQFEKAVDAPGFKLVPDVATDEMIGAACEAANLFRVDAMRAIEAAIKAS